MLPRRGFKGLRLDIGTCQLTEYDEDNFLAVQVDGYGEDATHGSQELHHPYGFLGRPRDPDADGGGALIQYWLEGDKGQAIALEDVRIAALLPAAKKGGSLQYGYTGSFCEIDGDTGTQTHYFNYAFVVGVATKAHLLQFGLDTNGKPIINIQSGEGPRLTILEKEITIANEAGDIWIRINPTEGTLSGNWKLTGALDVCNGTMPGPTSFPLAKAQEVITALNAIKLAFSLGGAGTGVVKLNGAEAVAAAIDAAIASLSTTMVKGF